MCSPFLTKLPAELRLKIYADVLTCAHPLKPADTSKADSPNTLTGLLRTCRIVYTEAVKVLYDSNTFKLPLLVMCDTYWTHYPIKARFTQHTYKSVILNTAECDPCCCVAPRKLLTAGIYTQGRLDTTSSIYSRLENLTFHLDAQDTVLMSVLQETFPADYVRFTGVGRLEFVSTSSSGSRPSACTAIAFEYPVLVHAWDYCAAISPKDLFRVKASGDVEVLYTWIDVQSQQQTARRSFSIGLTVGAQHLLVADYMQVANPVASTAGAVGAANAYVTAGADNVLRTLPAWTERAHKRAEFERITRALVKEMP